MDQRELTEKYVPNDDIYLFNTGGARMAYLTFGCRYIPGCGMHRFVVWAPNAREVSVVGDFNGWDSSADPMYRREDGVWCAFIPGVKQGDIYKYRVVDQGGNAVLKADPFAFHAETGPEIGRAHGLGHRGLAVAGRQVPRRARKARRAALADVHL